MAKSFTFKLFMWIFIALFASVVLAGGFIYFRLNQNIDTDKDIELIVEANQSVDAILRTLGDEGILSPSELMIPAIKLYFKLTNQKVFAGYYKFTSAMKNKDALTAIFRGLVCENKKVTFPEGITIQGFANILARELNISADDFVAAASNDSIIKAKAIPINNLEGYLYPATYRLNSSQSPKEILELLLRHQDKIWEAPEVQAKLAASKRTIHEVLTIASIVEAETPVIEERSRIAGVYLNRLRIGMRLQADPTVQYATGAKRRITYNDLEVNNRYNTYKFEGLPPGPINNPSKSSILAVLNPETHNYLYFVAVGDGSGRHNFATNFTQHKQFVVQYRKNRKNNQAK